MAQKKYERGSRRHVLDWLESPFFLYELNRLLTGTGAEVEPGDWWRPLSHSQPGEVEITTSDILKRIGTLDDPDRIKSSLQKWWLVHSGGATTPVWDLASTCTIKCKRGLLLVEAKAHEKECATGGKGLAGNCSENSRDNHQRIGTAIKEARDELDRLFPGGKVKISHDTHYQLCNRVAWSWKLASLGVPIVLVYLGFTDDKKIGDDFFRDELHWRHFIHSYMSDVLPCGFAGCDIPCGPGTMRLEIASRPVLSLSEPLKKTPSSNTQTS